MVKGRVCLVGAGCGDSGLLTLRGARRLRACTALVYDDLIDPSILDLAPPQALRFYMGKRRGQHSASQEEICEKLISLARDGHAVVRLKGGDPFVFGRGGEEILALQKAGIPWEEVPGISSAIAIPAAAGIPVTHRGVSRGFHVVTSHTAGGELPDLAALARLEGTLVFLMGLARLPEIAAGLMQAGLPPDTPAAVLSGGNSPNPAAVRGCLRDISQRSRGVLPPAIILVGQTAAMDLSLKSCRPLEGVRIGVTGTPSVADRLIPALADLGAGVIPLARTCTAELSFSLSREVLCSPAPHWVVFTSVNGVELFFRFLSRERIDLRRLDSCKFAVIGPATGAALASRGLYPDLCPPRHTSRDLALSLSQEADRGEHILLFRSSQGAPILPQFLREQGFSLTDLPVYQTQPAEDPPGTQERLDILDCITFASAGGVEEFIRRYRQIPPNARCVCIGEVTAAALARHWSGTPILARDTTVRDMVQAILDQFAR